MRQNHKSPAFGSSSEISRSARHTRAGIRRRRALSLIRVVATALLVGCWHRATGIRRFCRQSQKRGDTGSRRFLVRTTAARATRRPGRCRHRPFNRFLPRSQRSRRPDLRSASSTQRCRSQRGPGQAASRRGADRIRRHQSRTDNWVSRPPRLLLHRGWDQHPSKQQLRQLVSECGNLGRALDDRAH